MRARVALLTSLAWVLAATVTPPAHSADEPAPFTITIEDDAVHIGEDIVVRATFTNRSREAVAVPELRLARDSISVTLASEDAGLAAQELTRLYGSFVAGDAGLTFRPRATRRKRLAPGEEMSAELRVPALVLGRMSVSAALGAPVRGAGSPGRWTSRSRPTEPRKSRLRSWRRHAGPSH